MTTPEERTTPESTVRRLPEEAGASPARLARATALLDGWVAQGELPGVAAMALRRGVPILKHFAGSAGSSSWTKDDEPVDDRTIFALFSVTRPLVATAFMSLVEDGEVVLDDPVARFVPEFGRFGKDQVKIRHLLSHTSGLPDQLPNNESLRKARSPLASFVRATCRLELAFNPGTRVLFSAVAVLMLAEVAERVTRQPFADYLSARLLAPLGLRTAGLRPSEALYPRIAHLRLPEGRAATSWDANSPYWRQLGAPWGGAFATVEEVARYGQFFLDTLKGRGGAASRDGAPVLSPATARLMVQPHTRNAPSPQSADRPELWGLGWALKLAQGDHWSGDLTSAETFGHAGASGTMLWIDPVQEMVCVILTNHFADWPAERRRFATFSNALLSAVVG